jgi:DNA-binding CsgD family transcriptional regulator
MPKKGDAAGAGGRRPTNGGRAVPRTVPRGSFHLPQGKVFTRLGRTILDKLDRGVILMDAKGKVVDSNTLAARVIRAGDGIALRSGRLVFADPVLDARMVQAVVRREAGTLNDRAVIAARVRCNGSDAYSIVVTSVPPDADERDVAFFALLYAPNGQRDISTDVLRELYGLTRAQADVARSLFAGRSVEDTARALDLSLNTVRTHLKHVFTRCAVGSQAELLHLLTNGPNRL